MWDVRMIGVPNQAGKALVAIELPFGWVGGLSERQAEIGAPVLTYVTVLSEHEAREHNRRYRDEARESQRRRIEQEGPNSYLAHLDLSALKGADDVDELLDLIKQSGWYASWVIVERCTND